MAQLLGLLVSAMLTTILILTIYIFVIRKQIAGQAPTGRVATAIETYYEGFLNLLEGLSSGANRWSYPYIFTLFNFIFINTLVPWIGFESAATSIMFTFPLALITFIGTFVIGIGTMGLIQFLKHKYSNPMELVLQFAPLISMSVRLFAATLAGAIIGNVPWIVIQGITEGNLDTSWIDRWAPAMQALFMWVWKIVDTMLSLIQAFIFLALTVIFWSMDTGPTWSRKERAQTKHDAAHQQAIDKWTTVKSVKSIKEKHGK